MPLVVPALRFAMLFLNVYETYKTLKEPTPSARNHGRPSQRATSQRKRDMKGCLAVWIVWGCYITYERMAEAIVSLFVPFYDEFKSLALLFLIVTRARGAEPIFLHIIRPLLKPYTSTLDTLLDLVCMVGDILFALSTFPFRIALARWEKTFSQNESPLDSEVEGVGDLPARPDQDENEVFFRARPVLPSTPSVAASAHQETSALHFPRKTSSDRRSLGQNRRPSAEYSRSTAQRDPTAEGGSTNQPASSNGTLNGSRPRQIWHPPLSSYTDPEEDSIALTNDASGPHHVLREDFDFSARGGGTPQKQEEIDEWRQYPPFPSAYPPTPLIASSRLSLTSLIASKNPLDATILSGIPEDFPHQDFRPSLLSPREPLNPGFDGGLSDDDYTPGVQPNIIVSTAMVVDRDYGSYEEAISEDDFDVTLRTPLPPIGIARSRVRAVANRPISIASSVASRSTALTTADNGSSLRTRSSSESSTAISTSDLSSPFDRKRGRKRPLSRSRAASVKTRVRLLESMTTRSTSRSRGQAVASHSARTGPSHMRKVSRHHRSQSPSETDGAVSETGSSVDDADGKDHSSQKLPDMKKRKIILSPPRAVKAARPIRPRVARHATAPSVKIQQLKSVDFAPTAPRTSYRLRSSTRHPNIPHPAEASQTSSSSNESELVRPARLTGRNTTKKEHSSTPTDSDQN